MPEFVQYLLFVGFAALMFLLRLDARRFSAAEWDTEDGPWRVWLPRLSWYGAGLALGLLIFALHPAPIADLNLDLAPDRGEALMFGLAYGGAGIVGALVLAILRNGRIIDEFLFRGVLLGLLLTLDLPDWLAIVGAAFIYAGAIRASTGSRGMVMLVAWLAIGPVSGAPVLATAGIAAAFVGHSITRFALFMTMGQPEQAAVAEVAPQTGGTGDEGAYVIPPRAHPRGSHQDDGRGGPGPVRPA